MSKTPDIFTPPVGISPPDANYLDEVVSANTIIDERTGARSVNRTAIDRAIDFHNNAERANRPRSDVSSEELLRRP